MKRFLRSRLFSLISAGILAMAYVNCSGYQSVEIYEEDLASSAADFQNGEGPVSPELIAAEIKRQGLVASVAGSGGAPNVVFVITDDHQFRHLGVSGHPTLKTPWIDSLLETGFYFENLYVTTGQCAASRASIWTGQLPHQHGVLTNGYALPPRHLTMPDLFHSAGYQTGFFGKCHLGPVDPNQNHASQIYENGRGFDHFLWLPFTGSWMDFQITFQRTQKRQIQNVHITEYLTNETISFIDQSHARNPQKPFFAWLSHLAPHHPNILPARPRQYGPQHVVRAPNHNASLNTKPSVQRSSYSHDNFRRTGAAQVDQELLNAFENITFLDEQLGRIIRNLKDKGVWENTIFVFMSDNGLLYGEHQIFQKGPFMYEEIMKSPALISFPKKYANIPASSRRVRALASSTDLFPTLMEMIGGRAPARVEGRSLLPIMDGRTQSHRSSLMMQYYAHGNLYVAPFQPTPMRGLIKDSKKWVHYHSSTFNGVVSDGSEHELYDLARDPYEMNNLMADSGAGENPFLAKLASAADGSLMSDLATTSSWWQTLTLDPSRRKAIDVRFARLPGQLYISWKADAPTASEVWMKSLSTGQVLKLKDLNVRDEHKWILPMTQTSGVFDVALFNYGVNGNGGVHLQRVIVSNQNLQLENPNAQFSHQLDTNIRNYRHESTPGLLPGDGRQLRILPAGFDLGCGSFGTDRNFAIDTFNQWLFEMLPVGMPRIHYFTIAREAGYSGTFGANEHGRWLAENPQRTVDLERRLQEWLHTPLDQTGWTRHRNYQEARAQGYSGPFACGNHDCFRTGRCDSWGRLR